MPQFSGQSVSMSTCLQESVPKLNADHFNGDPLSWMKWFSTFQATIDGAPKTSPKKMIHLQSPLTGEAKALVNGYGCNGDLYVSAKNRLQEHFGNLKTNSKRISRKALKFQSPKPSPSGKLHTVLFFPFNNGGHFLTIRFHPRSTFNN